MKTQHSGSLCHYDFGVRLPTILIGIIMIMLSLWYSWFRRKLKPWSILANLCLFFCSWAFFRHRGRLLWKHWWWWLVSWILAPSSTVPSAPLQRHGLSSWFSSCCSLSSWWIYWWAPLFLILYASTIWYFEANTSCHPVILVVIW